MEERYRVLVDAITDYAIYMLDTGGHVSSWNTGANRFKGYVEFEILGEHFSRFYTPEDREKGVPAKALATAEAEGRFEAEGWRVRKDGERFWAHVIIDAIRDPDGQLVGFAKITRDLTERKAAEEVLRRSEEQFRRLVQGVTDYAIYMLDPEGRVASWNSQASDPVPGGTPVASTGPVGLPLPAEGDGRNDVGESVYGPLVVGCRRSGMPVEAPEILLAHYLKTLKLPTFQREYQKLARLGATEGVDHLGYLFWLSEREMIERDRRKVERRIKSARFPVVKSLDSFDFAAIPKLNKMQVLELFRCEWIERREN